MWAIFQSVDLLLNVAWLSLAITTLLAWRLTAAPREQKQALIAILFILVLVFPVISTADDVTEQALMYDLSASPLTIQSGKEIKLVIPPELQATVGLNLRAEPLADSISEIPVWNARSSSEDLLLCSASGIHSPPQF